MDMGLPQRPWDKECRGLVYTGKVRGSQRLSWLGPPDGSRLQPWEEQGCSSCGCLRLQTWAPSSCQGGSFPILPAPPRCTLLSEDPGLLPRSPFLGKGYRAVNGPVETRVSSLSGLSGPSILPAKFREGQWVPGPLDPTMRSSSFRECPTREVTNAVGPSHCWSHWKIWTSLGPVTFSLRPGWQLPVARVQAEGKHSHRRKAGKCPDSQWIPWP